MVSARFLTLPGLRWRGFGWLALRPQDGRQVGGPLDEATGHPELRAQRTHRAARRVAVECLHDHDCIDPAAAQALTEAAGLASTPVPRRPIEAHCHRA